MKYFKTEEFNCTHSGENRMDITFLNLLDTLRDVCGFPFVITSGYRCPWHPVELKKKAPGTHTKGIAADIQVSNGQQRLSIVKHAIELGFTGIGVAKGFVHVDTRNTTPVMWTYS